MEGLVPGDVWQSLSLGLSRTVLICNDIAERHIPDNCLQQFGMKQPLPILVQPWERNLEQNEDIDLFDKMKREIQEWTQRHQRIVKDDYPNEMDYKSSLVNDGNCSNEGASASSSGSKSGKSKNFFNQLT